MELISNWTGNMAAATGLQAWALAYFLSYWLHCWWIFCSAA